MPTIIDMVDASVNEGPEGLEATRVAIVTDLAGPVPSRLRSALEAPRIPPRGEPHPTIEHLFLVEKSAEPISGGTQARVTLSYRIPRVDDGEKEPDETAEGTTSVGATLTGAKTQRDVKGKQIVVEHTFIRKRADGTEVKDKQVQGGEVDFQIPQLVLQTDRVERFSPKQKAKAFVGTVNALPIGLDAKRTWLCTAIQGRTDNDGESYTVTYEFQFNPDTWDAIVVYIDKETGNPPPNLIEGEGIQKVQVYREANFLNLNIPF